MKKSKTPESVVRDIKRRTRRKFAAEEKIRIVLEGLKGEDFICQNEVVRGYSLLYVFKPKWTDQALI
jgi:transposase-like protein